MGTVSILKVEMARIMALHPPEAIIYDLQALDFLDSAGYRALISVPGFRWHPGMLRMRVVDSSQPYRYLCLVGADFLLDVTASTPGHETMERHWTGAPDLQPVDCADPVFNAAQHELAAACDAYAVAFLRHQNGGRNSVTESALRRAIERGGQAMRRMDAARERLAVRIIGQIMRMTPSESRWIDE